MKPHIFMATAMLFAFFLFSIPAKAADDDEEKLLQGLHPPAQAFFRQSMAVRAEYPENHPYKHFNRDRDGDGKVDVMDAAGYLWLVPPGRIALDDDDLQTPRVLYRLVKDCKTKLTVERQVIDLMSGYGNTTFTDRYQQQCIDDGTMDNYYVETSSPPDAD